jgi:hypothetical protein
MKHTYKIIVGDWSRDGHNDSDDYQVNVSHTRQEIHAAYEKAAGKCGIGLHSTYETHKQKKPRQILEEYEDNKITDADMLKLVKLGINTDAFEEYDAEDGAHYFQSKNVAILYLEMARTQLADFKYQFVESPVLTKGIGYGVFS